MAIGQDLLNVPIGDMIRQMAFAIADAQLELDESSTYAAEMMSGRRVLRNAAGEPVDKEGDELAEGKDPEFIDTRVYFGYDVVKVPEIDPTTKQPKKDSNGDQIFVDKKQPALVSMLELGFTPVFYQFIETVLEVKIAIKIVEEKTSETKSKGTQTVVSIGNWRRRGWLWGGGRQITTTPVDATYTNKYNYTAEGSSEIRTKLVPVPPPAILEDRIRALLELNRTEPTEPQINPESNQPEPKKNPVLRSTTLKKLNSAPTL